MLFAPGRIKFTVIISIIIITGQIDAAQDEPAAKPHDFHPSAKSRFSFLWMGERADVILQLAWSFLLVVVPRLGFRVGGRGLYSHTITTSVTKWNMDLSGLLPLQRGVARPHLASRDGLAVAGFSRMLLSPHSAHARQASEWPADESCSLRPVSLV